MTFTSKPNQLAPSVLGTKNHWDEAYSLELDNHAADPTDEGTIWFDENNAEDVIIEHLEGLDWSRGERATGSRDGSGEIKRGLRVVDIGTGNGHLLFALRDAGWRGEMLGLDYSVASVELAQKIQDARLKVAEETEDVSDEKEDSVTANKPIQFKVFDILHDQPGQWLQEGFDLALDKGTFDAISLCDDPIDAQGCVGCDVYASRAAALVRPGGWLVVTSCCWTVEELRSWMDVSRLLEYGDTIRFPQFEFGRTMGQTVSCVCFRRVVASNVES